MFWGAILYHIQNFFGEWFTTVRWGKSAGVVELGAAITIVSTGAPGEHRLNCRGPWPGPPVRTSENTWGTTKEKYRRGKE